MRIWKKLFGRSPPPEPELEIPDELRFPIPTFRIDSSARDAKFLVLCANYLGAVSDWRDGVLYVLDSEELTHRYCLSARARATLLRFLSAEWVHEERASARTSPYNLVPFPGEVLGAERDPAVKSVDVLDVLRWRAAVVDYLDDVVDVLGEPALTWEECAAMGGFLLPISAQSLCWFCLMPYSDDVLNPDSHDCVMLGHVRAKWPPSPFDVSDNRDA